MSEAGSGSKTPRNILAVRVGRVGDTVMMTPALRALIDYYPDAGITLLVSPVGRLLLKDFHSNVVDTWTWDRSGLLQPARDRRKLLDLLKQHDFDRVFCFDTSPRISPEATSNETPATACRVRPPRWNSTTRSRTRSMASSRR